MHEVDMITRMNVARRLARDTSALFATAYRARRAARSLRGMATNAYNASLRSQEFFKLYDGYREQMTMYRTVALLSEVWIGREGQMYMECMIDLLDMFCGNLDYDQFIPGGRDFDEALSAFDHPHRGDGNKNLQVLYDLFLNWALTPDEMADLQRETLERERQRVIERRRAAERADFQVAMPSDMDSLRWLCRLFGTAPSNSINKTRDRLYDMARDADILPVARLAGSIVSHGTLYVSELMRLRYAPHMNELLQFLNSATSDDTPQAHIRVLAYRPHFDRELPEHYINCSIVGWVGGNRLGGVLQYVLRIVDADSDVAATFRVSFLNVTRLTDDNVQHAVTLTEGLPEIVDGSCDELPVTVDGKYRRPRWAIARGVLTDGSEAVLVESYGDAEWVHSGFLCNDNEGHLPDTSMLPVFPIPADINDDVLQYFKRRVGMTPDGKV